MISLNNAQLIQSLKTALGDLTDDGLANLAALGGMLGIDLQTGQAKFWPGRKMEVHPHPKLLLGGSKNHPIAKRLQLWVAPAVSRSSDLENQSERDRLRAMVDNLVLDIRQKERVLPDMVKFAQVPAGHVFLMPQEVYNEYLRLGGHPRSTRPATVVQGMGVN
jgi:hypothetical protein